MVAMREVFVDRVYSWRRPIQGERGVEIVEVVVPVDLTSVVLGRVEIETIRGGLGAGKRENEAWERYYSALDSARRRGVPQVEISDAQNVGERLGKFLKSSRRARYEVTEVRRSG